MIYVTHILLCLMVNLNVHVAEDTIKMDRLVVDWAFRPVENLSSLDPEWDMTTDEIIRYHGYPIETHDVYTSDGYILSIHRIPHGKKPNRRKQPNPVIIQHGLLANSASWVFNIPEINLPYKLADAGYDVWLSNFRGNEYGKRHKTLSVHDAEFWDFSFHEMALHDLPAVIDYVIEKTGKSQVNYIGHSMGTLTAAILLSIRPEYNNKIRLAAFMAPALTLKYSTDFFLRLLPPYSFVEWLLKSTYGSEVPLNKILKYLVLPLCQIRDSCATVIPSMFGYRGTHNLSRVPVYVSHVPDSASAKTLLHYVQTIKILRKYDYGKANMEVYGQAEPPLYELGKITAPVALVWSDADPFGNPLLASYLRTHLRSVVYDYRVPFDYFNHLDYIIMYEANEMVYDELVRLFEDQSIYKYTRIDHEEVFSRMQANTAEGTSQSSLLMTTLVMFLATLYSN